MPRSIREASTFPCFHTKNSSWKATLAAYQAPHLDKGIDDALKDFVAKKKVSMKDI